MKKKFYFKKMGFTLIELLAVIVILAIILLIVMPIVINVINDTRKGAFEATARGLVKIAENQYMKKHLRDETLAMDYVFEDGEQTEGDPLKFSGRGPKDGIIRVHDDGDIEIAIHDDRWCITKDRNNRDINLTIPYDGDCSLPDSGNGSLAPIYDDAKIDCLINDNCGGITLPDYYVGTEGTWIPIASGTELDNVRHDAVNTFGVGTIWEDDYNGGLDKNYLQVANVNLSGFANWDTLGNFVSWSGGFEGFFDGNGYEIANLTIVRGEEDNVGLFNYVDGAILNNIVLMDVDVLGSDYVGALVGLSWDTWIVNCSVSGGIVKGNEYVGGLVGEAMDNEIANTYSTVTVEGDDAAVGGLIGNNGWNNLLVNSYASGNVTAAEWIVGGLAGLNEHEIINSYATGNVHGSQRVGGLVGWTDATIENSYATGSVSDSGNGEIGGLVGRTQGGDIINSYALGNVNGSGSSWAVGGLVGWNQSTISFSYAAGSVDGDGAVGGLIGFNQGSASNSYWDIEITGQTESDGGDGRNTAAMKSLGTYSSWNIATQNDVTQDEFGWNENYIWGIGTLNNGYPFLRVD